MSFDDAKRTCEAWVKDRPQYQLIDTDQATGKLLFLYGDKSFYCVSPEHNNGQWMVWSDNDKVIPELHPVVEYLEACSKRTINQILTKIDSMWNQNDPVDEIEEDIGSDYDEDDMDDYYMEDDVDAIKDDETKASDSDDDNSAEKFFTGDGSRQAVTRLYKDLKELKKSDGKFGVQGEPRGDNLFVWDVKLTDFDGKSRLGKDILDWARKNNREPVVYIEMKFPKEYPMAPPFVRVIRPRFKFLTGHVTIGGSVCMELLTRSGWLPSNDIEGILVQIRAEIMSDPDARLDHNPDQPYDEKAAVDAFERMVAKYGWKK